MEAAHRAIDLYMIRHGETELNLDRRIIAGRSNYAELTVLGTEQARKRGERFRSDGIYPDAVFSSPAVRCRETARVCLEALGADHVPIIDERLQEASQGVWEGRPRTSVYTDVVIGQIKRQGKKFRAPGGESVNDVATRMISFFNEAPQRLEADDGEGRVVFVFGHGFATRILAGTLLGWSMQKMRRETTPNASTSLFAYDGEDWRVKQVGELVITGA